MGKHQNFGAPPSASGDASRIGGGINLSEGHALVEGTRDRVSLNAGTEMESTRGLTPPREQVEVQRNSV